MSAVSLSCARQLFLIILLCGSLVVFLRSYCYSTTPTTSDGHHTPSSEVSLDALNSSTKIRWVLLAPHGVTLLQERSPDVG